MKGPAREVVYKNEWCIKEMKHAIKVVKCLRDMILFHSTIVKREDLGRKVHVEVRILNETLKSDPKPAEK